MSYEVRDDNALFGPGAGVELPNGAGASTVVAHQVIEVCGLFGINAGAATGNDCVFIAPPNPSAATGIAPLGSQYKILGVQYNYDVASASGTFAIEVTAPGTATGSGVNALNAATVSTAVAATNIPSSAALNTNPNNLLIAPNSRVNIKWGGTATGLVNCSILVYIARTA